MNKAAIRPVVKLTIPQTVALARWLEERKDALDSRTSWPALADQATEDLGFPITASNVNGHAVSLGLVEKRQRIRASDRHLQVALRLEKLEARMAELEKLVLSKG